MRNRDKWQPTKYVDNHGLLRASRDRNDVAIASRLIVDLVARFYGADLPLHAKGRLLDLGCGKAPLFAAYREYVTEIVCADWRATRHGDEYLDLECDLGKGLPFKDQQFDTIILSDVLEHIPEPAHLWREMARVLSVDGKIIMNVPFYYWLHEQPYDYFRYTEFALRRFVERSGLKLIRLDPIGGAPEILADMFAKNFWHLPIVGRSLTIFTQFVALCFIKTRLGSKVSAATSRRFPLGYFLVAEKGESGCVPI